MLLFMLVMRLIYENGKNSHSKRKKLALSLFFHIVSCPQFQNIPQVSPISFPFRSPSASTHLKFRKSSSQLCWLRSSASQRCVYWTSFVTNNYHTIAIHSSPRLNQWLTTTATLTVPVTDDRKCISLPFRDLHYSDYEYVFVCVRRDSMAVERISVCVPWSVTQIVHWPKRSLNFPIFQRFDRFVGQICRTSDVNSIKKIDS